MRASTKPCPQLFFFFFTSPVSVFEYTILAPRNKAAKEVLVKKISSNHFWALENLSGRSEDDFTSILQTDTSYYHIKLNQVISIFILSLFSLRNFWIISFPIK